jgi:hypothetical protein
MAERNRFDQGESKAKKNRCASGADWFDIVSCKNSLRFSLKDLSELLTTHILNLNTKDATWTLSFS